MGLKKNQGLKKLRIGQNSIGNRGVNEIAMAFIDNPLCTIEEVDFSK